MSEFPITDKTKITRLPKRGVQNKDEIYKILDEALFCTVAFNLKGQPFQIPTGFCRIDNTLYIHGSVGSHYMRELASNNLPVNVNVTFLDGLVLARSAFHHSVNYRSVSVFSSAKQVTDQKDRDRILEVFTEKMCKGRWNDIRKPTEGEWKATMVIAFEIEEASAKVRTGPPVDDDEDYSLNVWAGVLPMAIERKPPIADPKLKSGVNLPPYLT
jgi:hypothetical protein